MNNVFVFVHAYCLLGLAYCLFPPQLELCIYSSRTGSCSLGHTVSRCFTTEKENKYYCHKNVKDRIRVTCLPAWLQGADSIGCKAQGGSRVCVLLDGWIPGDPPMGEWHTGPIVHSSLYSCHGNESRSDLMDSQLCERGGMEDK